MKKRMYKTQIRLDAEMEQNVKQRAKDWGVSINRLITIAIKKLIESTPASAKIEEVLMIKDPKDNNNED